MQGRAVANTAFDAAHVTPTDPGLASQVFLRKMALFSEFPDAEAEPPEGGVFGGSASLRRHALDAESLHLFGPRPIGYNDRRSSLKLRAVL